MRVLVAGATGVIGRPLVPLLSSVGHEVVVLARTPGRASLLERTGTSVVIADALDAPELSRAVRKASPDAVVNLLTSIPAAVNPRRLAKEFATTNRLRTEGTRNLLAAAGEVAASRVVSEGLAYAYDPNGSGLANEDTPFWQDPPRQFVPVLAALKELERQTRDAGGTVLRFGHLYGAGSVYASGGSFVAQVRAGKIPLVNGGTSTFSFTHAQDAASAIVAVLDKPIAGALNVVDDDPAPMHEWLPVLAGILRAKPPKSAPAAIARLAVGGWGVAFMTRLRGADNSRARLGLDWKPRHASWRTGFAEELRAAGSRTA